MTCKWLSDDDQEICCNGDCPACADFCPCCNYPEICKYAEDEEEFDEAEQPKKKRKYKETDTACDTCEFLAECKEKGNAIEITSSFDTRKHYLKNIMADCKL